MTSREIIILLGLALAAWGHLMLHELLGADAVWTRWDGIFPAAWRTPPAIAGHVLLGIGACCVLASVVG